MRIAIFIPFKWMILVSLSAVPGCQQMNMPSIPVVDSILPDDTVPPTILARHGPTSTDRVEQIQQHGRSAINAAPEVRQQISEALAEQYQQESDPVVRQTIVKAISECRTGLSYRVMSLALHDQDTDVQIAGCRAWGDWGTKDSAQFLGHLIRDDKAELDVKLAAAMALTEVHHPESIRALSPALEKTQNPALQHQAVMSLQSLSDRDYGNDLVAWRNFVGSQSGESSALPPAASPTEPFLTEPSPSLVKRVLFWWK